MTEEKFSTDGAICPHCENLMAAQDDNYDLYNENLNEYVCTECGIEFEVDVYARYSWTTRALDDD